MIERLTGRHLDERRAVEVVGCISGWRDGLDVLGLAVDSLLAAGPAFGVCYLDGSYRTYCFDERLADTPREGLPVVRSPGREIYHQTGRWFLSEAEKRTELAWRAEADFPSARWLLYLDADERLEVSGDGTLEGGPRLAALLREREEEWASINLYQPRPGLDAGFALPRLLATGQRLLWTGHTDWKVWAGEGANLRRIAPLPGEANPLPVSDGYAVPVEVARIRHERVSRPPWRLAASGRYARLYRGPQGACRAAPNELHAYVLDGRSWLCTACERRAPAEPEEAEIEAALLEAT